MNPIDINSIQNAFLVYIDIDSLNKNNKLENSLEEFKNLVVVLRKHVCQRLAVRHKLHQSRVPGSGEDLSRGISDSQPCQARVGNTRQSHRDPLVDL